MSKEGKSIDVTSKKYRGIGEAHPQSLVQVLLRLYKQTQKLAKCRRKLGYTRPNRNRENLQLRGQIAQESSTDDVNEDIKVTQQVRNSGKAIQNSDGRSSHPAITRIGQSDQVFPEQFRNELVTEQQQQIHDLLHQLPIRNSEISERNGDIDRQITLLCPLVEKDHSMEESYQAQELQSLNFISL